MRLAVARIEREDTMVHTITVHRALAGIGRFLEHAAAVVVGLILMIVGLGLGVTMIMLPVGIVIGLLGVAIVVAGMFARIDQRS
jgi:membrane-bound ClpP family serine protease